MSWEVHRIVLHQRLHGNFDVLPVLFTATRVCVRRKGQPTIWLVQVFVESARRMDIGLWIDNLKPHGLYIDETLEVQDRRRTVGFILFPSFPFFWIQELVTVAKSDLEADNEVIKGSRPVMRRPDKNRMDWRRHLLPKRLFVNFDSGESRHIDFLGRSRVKDRYTRFSLWPGCCCRRLKTDSKGMRLCWFSARSKFRFQRKVFHPFKIIAE